MRVLVLEDDPNLLMAYADALRDDGHTVDACQSVDAAMRQLMLHGPAIEAIILDLCVGSGTSVSVADYAGYAAPDAEVIMVTGSGLYPNGDLQSLSANINWALRKPVRMFDLQAMLKFADHRKQRHLRPSSADRAQ